MGTVRRAWSMLSDLGIGQRMRRRYCSRKRMHSTRSRKKRGNGHYILIEKVMNLFVSLRKRECWIMPSCLFLSYEGLQRNRRLLRVKVKVKDKDKDKDKDKPVEMVDRDK